VISDSPTEPVCTLRFLSSFVILHIIKSSCMYLCIEIISVITVFFFIEVVG